MTAMSIFEDDVSTEFPGIWFVSRTTPIEYPQPNPDEIYLILGHDLDGAYPDRTDTAAEASDPVAGAALTESAAIRYITQLAIREESAGGAVDGMMQMQMSSSADQYTAGAASPFTAAAQARARIALRVEPNGETYQLQLQDLIDSDGEFGWMTPASLVVGPGIWSVLSAATRVITVIYDPESSGIDAGALEVLPPSAPSAPSTPSYPVPPAPLGETQPIMWCDVITAGVRYGPLRDINAFRMSEKIGEPARFSITLTVIGDAAQIDDISEIYVYGLIGGHITLIIAGRVITTDSAYTETETVSSCVCSGFGHDLLFTAPVERSWFGRPHSEIASDLAALMPAGWQLHADPEASIVLPRLDVTADTVADALLQAAEAFGSRLHYSPEKEIWLRRSFSSLPIAATRDGGQGARIEQIRRQSDARRLITRLRPETADGLRLLGETAVAAQDGLRFEGEEIVDEASELRYGLRRSVQGYPEAEVVEGPFGKQAAADLAAVLGMADLSRRSSPRVSYKISVVDPRQLLRPWQALRITSHRPVLNAEMRVENVATQFDGEVWQQSIDVSSDGLALDSDDATLISLAVRNLVRAQDAAVRSTRSETYVGLALTAHGRGAGQGFFFPASRGDRVTSLIDVPGDGADYAYALGEKPAAPVGNGTVVLTDDILTDGPQRLVVTRSPTPPDPVSIPVSVTVTA